MKKNLLTVAAILGISGMVFSADASTAVDLKSLRSVYEGELPARQMEALDRGLVAVKVTNGVYLSWRLLGTDDPQTQFEVYRNGTLIKTISATEATNYSDTAGTITSAYEVKAIVGGAQKDASKTVTPWANQYKTIQLNRPQGGKTPPNVEHGGTSTSTAVNYPDGQDYTYLPNDCSVADLDGDGEYEIIVKWDPTNSKDNSQTGITGNVYIDAYKLDGTQLWRIDLGPNIRAGAHYTQFMVYDFDGDGIAELVCKTAPGTIDGEGNSVIRNNDNPNADYRNLNLSTSGSGRTGFITSGPEYLTLFDGKTGKELNTVAYEVPRGSVSGWGDNYGNRVDRFLACVAYLDGIHPSVVMCRGYYTRATLVAYDVKDKKLVKRWTYDSGTSNSTTNIYGQGNHNLSVADVDGDGKDEIIFGSAAISSEGKFLYRTGLGHGDAMHLSDLDPDRPGLEVWQITEEKTKYNHAMYDARTGQVIWHSTGIDKDNGRGMAADVDPNHRGFEMWSNGETGTYNCKGEQISTGRPSSNFRIYWDGDLQDELLDGSTPTITKWSPSANRANNLFTLSGTRSVNGSKNNPCLSGDILGDWREEVIAYVSSNPSQLRIYTTIIPTTHRLYTLMHDPVYRLGIAWQNVAYNQPPHLGFYIGDGVEDIPMPNIYTPVYTVGTGICKDATVSVALEVYVDASGLIRVVSPDSNIQSVSIYSIDGMLLHQNNNINQSEYLYSLVNRSRMIIVKAVTTQGIKTVKVSGL